MLSCGGLHGAIKIKVLNPSLIGMGVLLPVSSQACPILDSVVMS
jgi:hypothetical protein